MKKAFEERTYHVTNLQRLIIYLLLLFFFFFEIVSIYLCFFFCFSFDILIVTKTCV